MLGVCCTHFEGGDCQAIQGHCADGCAWEEAAWERLAAYEDTGLEPEEVTQIKLAIMGKSLAEIKEFEGVSIDRMIELTQAEKDGRLVVLSAALTALRRTEGDNVTNENLFPKRLKTLREKRGMSQRTLAQLCGLSRNIIGQYERGEKDPSLKTLLEIADYFGVSVDYLLGRKKI